MPDVRALDVSLDSWAAYEPSMVVDAPLYLGMEEDPSAPQKNKDKNKKGQITGLNPTDQLGLC